MKKYHILYDDKNGDFQNEVKPFLSFSACEKWLESIGATYWEIEIL